MTQAEIDALAHEIAEQTARACFWDLSLSADSGWRKLLSDAMYSLRKLRYLEARGLLERHPERSELVRVKAERIQREEQP